MTTIGYIRVSTDKQARNGLSLDAQREMIHSYAATYSLEPLEFRVEPGESGATIKGRKVLRALLEEVTAGGVAAIIVTKLERMFRNTREALETLELFRERDVAFHAVQERLDTSSPMGRFFLTMLAAIAQLDREQIAERTRTTMRMKKRVTSGQTALHVHRRDAGKLAVGRPPYGYQYVRKQLVEEAKEMAVVRKIRGWAGNGYAPAQIERKLQDERIFSRKGRPWQLRQIIRIIKAPYYDAALGTTA